MRPSACIALPTALRHCVDGFKSEVYHIPRSFSSELYSFTSGKISNCIHCIHMLPSDIKLHLSKAAILVINYSKGQDYAVGKLYLMDIE